MGVKEASRNLEFTNALMHCGWCDARSVFVAFSAETAKTVFESHPTALIICVAPPHSVVAETFEQVIHFFSDDTAIAFAKRAVFAT